MDYNNYLNPTLVSIKPSGIRKFFSIAEEMDDVISLGVGEPDFKTPWHIRQTGINSLEQGATRYTANAGLILLRNEIANYYKRCLLYTSDAADDLLWLFVLSFVREMRCLLLSRASFAISRL